jgi:hypothetical protein
MATGGPAALLPQAAVRDMLQRQDLGSFKGRFSAKVMPHDVVAVRISPAVEGAAGAAAQEGRGGDDGWRPWRNNQYIERHARRRSAAQAAASRHASRAARVRWAAQTSRPQGS